MIKEPCAKCKKLVRHPDTITYYNFNDCTILCPVCTEKWDIVFARDVYNQTLGKSDEVFRTIWVRVFEKFLDGKEVVVFT